MSKNSPSLEYKDFNRWKRNPRHFDILMNRLDVPFYAYLDDKITLYEVYKSASDFAAVNNLNPWQAYRYINKERAIPINEGTQLIYLCCNPIYHKNMLDIKLFMHVLVFVSQVGH